jgi:CRISPR-associated protein Cmr5
MLTREQQYAAKIFEQVTELEQASPEKKTKYGSMAHKLPVLIRVAGLSQALHFVHSRCNDDQKLLLKHLAHTLDIHDDTGEKAQSAVEKLLESSRMSQLSMYMYLTHQALAALQWYKRFAQSVLKVESGEDEASGAARS